MEWFTSDWHLGHRNLLSFGGRTEFSSIEEMNDIIVSNMLSVMKRNDSLYFLGDLAFNRDLILPTLRLFKEKQIKFFWIVGNHDMKYKAEKFSDLCEKIELTHIFKKDKKVIHLSHFPMRLWHRSFDNTYHLYGHVHKFSKEIEMMKKDYGKSFNVNVEFNNYKPYSFDDIITIMNSKPDNIDKIYKDYSLQSPM